MSAQDNQNSAKAKNPRWGRRIFIGVLLLVVGLALLLLGIRWWITTDSGISVLERQIEARQLGPIKRVEIDTLSGDPLDALSIKALRLYDEDGVWLTASDINLDWSPWPLRKRHLLIEDLDVARIEVLRRPRLEDTQPGKPFTARIKNADISALDLAETVIGQAAILKIKAQGGLLEDSALEARLNVVRTDQPGDEINLDFSRDATGTMSGDFTLNGAPGGPLAQLLRAPSTCAVTGQGKILGDIQAGSGAASIDFGEARAIDADVKWSPETAALEAVIQTGDWTIFDASRQALGETLSLTAALDRSASPQRFEVSANSNHLDAKLSGQLDEDGGLPETFDFDIRTDNLGAFSPLPEGYTLAAGSAAGQFQRGEKLAARADINLAAISTPYGRAARIAGPVSLSADGSVYRLNTDLRAISPATTAQIPFALGEEARLKASVLLNPDTRQATELNATLSSGNNTVSAKGRAAFDASVLRLDGQVEARLKSIGSIPPGMLRTDYNLSKTADSDLAVTANGAFRPQGSFAPPLDGLLGNIINFDINMLPVEGGLRIQDSLVTSEGLRAAAIGRVTDTLDISAEVAISRPLSLASLDITEDSAFSATLTGPRNDPNLRFDGTVGGATLAGQSFEDIRLRTEITDILSAPRGPVRLTAETAHGPLDIEAQLSSTPAGYAVSDLDVSLAALSASGELALNENNIATGQLSLNLPQEGNRYARARVDLDNLAGEQGVTLNAEAKNVVYQTYAIETLALTAAGTLANLTGDVSLEGRTTDTLLTREFTLNTPLTLSRSAQNNYQLSLKPEADYGRYQLGHRDSVVINYEAGDFGIEGPFTLNGTPLDFSYNREAGSENLRVRGRDLPVNLLPLPGNLAETRGLISLNLNARHSGQNQLSGQGIVKVTDWRGFAYKPGQGLTSTLSLDIQPNSVNWRLGTEDTQDLSVEGQGNIPLLSGDSLISIRPNMSAALKGKLGINGSAKPILSLLTAPDAEPDGQIVSRLDIGGTLGNPQVQGQANAQDIRLELPEIGTRLREGRFRANFTNDTIDVSDVYIRDGKDGVMQGEGRFKLGEFGRPIGRLQVEAKKFRALDRKDYEGRVSGSLFFESDTEAATLGGDVFVNQAEVKQFVQGRAAVVEIEVEEINGQMDDIAFEPRPQTSPIKLDLRVRAPRRIFVRTRGLDVELAMDVKIKGTTAEPLLYGTANIVRGGYRIAGKELQFTEGGIEFDGTLQNAAVNLKAETDTQNINATLDISGTVEKPEIKLSSTPERPQDEILSALLFGRSVTELSTIEAAQLAGALAQFSGAGGGFDLMGGLRDALGVGQLSIGVGEDGQANITGGRYLAKDVYLQIFTGTGPDSTGALIDWEIRKNLSLRSKVQSDNEQTLILKYKKDF